MQVIDYIIETKSPVAFAEKNNDSTLYTTKKYIPGTAFRGMLANKFIQDHKLKNAHEDKTFFDIFLSGKVRFLPAYPIGNTNSTDYEPFIIPISVTKSKDGKIVKDLADTNTIVEAGFKKMKGFALKQQNTIYPIDVDTQIDLHMSRTKDKSRITGSSKDGDIFNYEYIEPYQNFRGSLIVDDDLAETVNSALTQINSNYINIGHSKNVQYGKCSCSINPPKEINLISNLNLDENIYLYTLTPYIPYETWQRIDDIAKDLLYTICQKLSLDIQITDEDLNITDTNNNKRLGIFASNEEISGFVGVWQAQHERKTALSAGSLIVLPKKIVEQIDLQALTKILYQGLGYRTSEGFGQFRLWQTTDLKLEKLPKIKQDTKLIICDEVKKVAKTIVKQRILTELKELAAKDANRQNIRMDTVIDSTAKNVLNRLEDLMAYKDSNNHQYSKTEIQTKIRAFKDKAKNNLRHIYLKGDILLDVLLEEENNTLPYHDFDIATNLNLSEQHNLKADLDDVFTISEDEKYRIYWLWFVRHAKKEITTAKNENQDIANYNLEV